jgi:NAD(P)-binding Rossmann-like domain
MDALTVVGGGLGGLVAAITAAERGAEVRLYEAHARLGGRWRASDPPLVLHEGPHVIYRDGPLYPWLRRRGLLGTTRPVPVSALRRFGFRLDGRLRHRPPVDLLRVLLARPAPVDASFTDWATDRFGGRAARRAAAAGGVALFHPRPGDLSAAFVHERLRRVFALPPQAGYREGGWGRLMDDLGGYVRGLGVLIETGKRIDRRPDGPVIVATSLAAARALLDDDRLDWPSGQVGLLDLSLRRAPGDAFVVSDLDEGGWLEDFSVPDPTLTPAGCSAVQIQLPLRPGDDRSAMITRLERLADLGLPGWRDRVEFRRDAIARGRTGAVDYPGRSWRDRPAIDQGDGVYLVGDQVAAPGLLSEVSVTSGIQAGQLAAGRLDSERARFRSNFQRGDHLGR